MPRTTHRSFLPATTSITIQRRPEAYGPAASRTVCKSRRPNRRNYRKKDAVSAIQRSENACKPKLRKKAGTGEFPAWTVPARERLPNRRASETFDFEVEGLRYHATVSRFADGRIGEIFIGNPKVGSQSDANATDAAVAASLALQHGCTLDVLRGALLRGMRGRATTPLGLALDLAVQREDKARQS